MKKLRLLLFDKCERNCQGCCNKQWNIDSLPVVHCNELEKYKLIMLTGGKPLLDPDLIIRTAILIRLYNYKGPIYVYTAKTIPIQNFLSILPFVDGITLTLHEKPDDANFMFILNPILLHYPNIKSKSLRLNVFDSINIDEQNFPLWKIKKNIKWIKNCPLPENEEFKKINWK